MLGTDYIQDCLSRRVIFFTGKGGVGKSSLAWATALACQQRGKRVLVVSWSTFDQAARPFTAQFSGIASETLETLACFREYALLILKFEKIYDTVFDNFVLNAFIQAAPGVSETVIGGKLWYLAEKANYDLILVDLPSSGHTLSFFQSPLGVKKVFTVGFVSKETEKILGMFRSPQTRVDFVALPEELPMVECLQLKNKLESLHALNMGYLHINQLTPQFEFAANKPLPPNLEQTVAQYRARVEKETAALALLPEFKLTPKFVPRLAAPDAASVIRAVAKLMGEK